MKSRIGIEMGKTKRISGAGLRGPALLLSVFLLLLPSCAQRTPEPEEILLALLESAEELPTGEIYSSEQLEGEEGFISDSLWESLYGEDASRLREITEAMALYLPSFPLPIEITVLRCYSSEEAREAEQILRSRLDALTVAYAHTRWESVCRNGILRRNGRTLALLILPEGGSATEETERLMRAEA